MEDFCRGCGTPYVTDVDRFCAKCGNARTVSAAPDAPPTSPEPDKESPELPTKKAGSIIAIVAVVALVIPLLIFVIGDCGSAEGRMAVTASPHGEWTFVPTGCASMQPYGMMGANLHGDGHNDGAVYVTLDHVEGHKVELEVPGSCRNSDGTDCTVFRVPRDQCETFDVTLDYTGSSVNDVRLVEGRVRLSCSLPDGTRIEGAIEFDGC